MADATERGDMRYTVEFEIQSDNGDIVSETLYKALAIAFGSVDKLRITPVRTYIGHIQENQPFIWSEIRRNQ
jgi:hypothetical protein